MNENNEEFPSLALDVWVIKDRLNKEPDETVYISAEITVRELKQYLCSRLHLDMNRYEFFILEKPELGPVLREIGGLETASISSTGIINTCKVCLKFEDINWNFSQNDDLEYNLALQQSLICQKQIFFDKIEKITRGERHRIHIKKLSHIKKSLQILLADLKLD
ncbi:hypothetical protein SteCoe_26105 [Stentor coeruleus]|uniref:Uncharacterized protein n=1 Tax=Stentor coeruleus TaxID=5963 RepID=A0A1R2BDN0_9CILI|nr:hypothetical protein SteCoe_26105 [Stentor coeruleus]